jgi:hypothetical protein
MGMAYLRVQKPPDTTLLTGFFPAPDTGEHESKQGHVRGEGGEGANLSVLCIHQTYNSCPGTAVCSRA